MGDTTTGALCMNAHLVEFPNSCAGDGTRSGVNQRNEPEKYKKRRIEDPGSKKEQIVWARITEDQQCNPLHADNRSVSLA